MKQKAQALCVFVLTGALLALPACQSGGKTKKPAPKAAAAKPPERAPSQEAASPVETYTGEFRERDLEAIFDMAEQDKWAEAEVRAETYYRENPNDPAAQRVLGWVRKQRDLRRNQAIEDRIRAIDSDNSVFNPTLFSLAKEKKDRGLPPRKDLRDAILDIESTPYVPESYGKTVHKQGKLFDYRTEKGRMSEVLEKEISVHLDNVSLENIIFKIGQAEGINFVADKSLPAFQKKLSVNMQKVKLEEFLKYVTRNLDVHFQVGDDLIWIVDGKDNANLLEETRFYRLKKGFIMPAQFGANQVDRTRVDNKGVITVTERETIEKFVQDGAPDKPYLEQAIEKFFKGSSYMVDYERNIIVATGMPEQLEVLERIIEEFDQPIQQVLIEARFVTVTEAAFMELGALWETGRSALTTSRQPTDFLEFGFNTGLGLEETWADVLGRDELSVTLSALEQSGESQILSSPRITLVNNLPARISDGKVQYYYEEYQVTQTVVERATASTLAPKGTPATITSGVKLDVLASIGGDGHSILLALRPEVNQDVELKTFATITDRNVDGEVVSTFDIRLPESRTQSLETRVIVQSGETVVMGGVLEREQTTFVDSVPFLGNLPLIGALFRKRTEVDKPRYLLIFVTATLLSESGEFVTYGSEESEYE